MRTIDDILSELEINQSLLAQGKMSAKQRNALKDSQFAYIDSSGGRHLPINDAGHTRAAMSRFNQTHFESPAKKASARRKIVNAAKRFGIDTAKFGKSKTTAQGGSFGTGYGKPSGTTIRTGQPTPLVQAAHPGMIVQANEECRVITAVLQTPDQENDPPMNRPGEVFEYSRAAVRDMAWQFAEEGLFNAIGVGHKEVNFDTGEITTPQGENAVMVESYLAPTTFNLIDPDGENRMILQGSWVGSFRITNDDVWEGIKDGTYKAPSIVVDDFDEEVA